MKFEDKVNAVIGKPYDANAFHCWDLVEYLLPEAPKVSLEAKSIYANVKGFKEESKKYNLEPVLNFRNKDIILLGNNETFFHAGVYFEQGVIHASEKGVVYESLSKIKRSYSSVKGLRI